MSPPTKKKQFNVYLPPDLVKQLKHLAIDRGVHLSPMVEQIFREYLAAQAKTKEKR